MWEETMRFVLRKEIISLLLTIGLGLSGCATQEQIRAELESEEGRALIKEVVQEENERYEKISNEVMHSRWLSLKSNFLSFQRGEH
jgi:hypothetical protein